MQRAIKFRRRLMNVGIFMLLLLLLALAAGVRSGLQTREMNQWIAHTQEVLTEASSVRVQRARMQNDLWFYRATGNQELEERYKTERQKLMESLEKLATLTRDNDGQRKSIEQVRILLEKQIEKLDAAIVKSEKDHERGQAQDFTPVIALNDELPGLMNEFERTEHKLFDERSASVRRSVQWTLVLMAIAGILTCILLLFVGYYIQREILTRAQIETGLRRARELLGAQITHQQSELGHAMDDLHEQIVARNQAEEEMKRLNAELEARVAKRTEELAEMNRELESFNYSVSHDLRAPLRHMDGFSRILEEEFAPKLPEEARHYLRRIRLAAGQMTEIVDDLLQLARLGRQAVKPRRVLLDQLVNETIEACTEQGSGREIQWEVAPLPEVEADPSLLRQVLINVISNAIKFTKKRERATIEIGSLKSNSEITVFVKDNGAGFDPRFADKLFGVFQRLHRQDEFEGTGIGLAIVARVIHRHGGRVWAESELEQGATFYFTLPSATERANGIPQQAEAIA